MKGGFYFLFISLWAAHLSTPAFAIAAKSAKACDLHLKKLEKLVGQGDVEEDEVLRALAKAKVLARHRTHCELSVGEKAHAIFLPTVGLYRSEFYCIEDPSDRITVFFDSTGFIQAFKFQQKAKVSTKCVL